MAMDDKIAAYEQVNSLFEEERLDVIRRSAEEYANKMRQTEELQKERSRLLSKLKKELRAILMSAGREGVDGPGELNRDYEDIHDEPIPYWKLGFPDLMSMLDSLPDVVQTSSFGNRCVHFAVSHASTNGIEGLILTTKPKSNKPTRLGGTIPVDMQTNDQQRRNRGNKGRWASQPSPNLFTLPTEDQNNNNSESDYSARRNLVKERVVEILKEFNQKMNYPMMLQTYFEKYGEKLDPKETFGCDYKTMFRKFFQGSVHLVELLGKKDTEETWISLKEQLPPSKIQYSLPAQLLRSPPPAYGCPNAFPSQLRAQIPPFFQLPMATEAPGLVGIDQSVTKASTSGQLGHPVRRSKPPLEWIDAVESVSEKSVARSMPEKKGTPEWTFEKVARNLAANRFFPSRFQVGKDAELVESRNIGEAGMSRYQHRNATGCGIGKIMDTTSASRNQKEYEKPSPFPKRNVEYWSERGARPKTPPAPSETPFLADGKSTTDVNIGVSAYPQKPRFFRAGLFRQLYKEEAPNGKEETYSLQYSDSNTARNLKSESGIPFLETLQALYESEKAAQLTPRTIMEKLAKALDLTEKDFPRIELLEALALSGRFKVMDSRANTKERKSLPPSPTTDSKLTAITVVEPGESLERQKLPFSSAEYNRMEAGSMDRIIHVNVASFDTPECFHVVLHSNLAEAMSFWQSMKNVYSKPYNSERLSIPREEITKSMLVAAPFQKGWYRAEVLSVNERKGTADVYFVDFGNPAEVPFESLKYLIITFMTMPAQAMRVAINQLKPISGLSWDENTEKRFLDLVGKEKPLEMFVASIDNSGLIKIHDLRRVPEEGKSTLFIAETLIAEGLAREEMVDCEREENLSKETGGTKNVAREADGEPEGVTEEMLHTLILRNAARFARRYGRSPVVFEQTSASRNFKL